MSYPEPQSVVYSKKKNFFYCKLTSKCWILCHTPIQKPKLLYMENCKIFFQHFLLPSLQSKCVRKLVPFQTQCLQIRTESLQPENRLLLSTSETWSSLSEDQVPVWTFSIQRITATLYEDITKVFPVHPHPHMSMHKTHLKSRTGGGGMKDQKGKWVTE